MMSIVKLYSNQKVKVKIFGATEIVNTLGFIELGQRFPANVVFTDTRTSSSLAVAKWPSNSACLSVLSS